MQTIVDRRDPVATSCRATPAWLDVRVREERVLVRVDPLVLADSQRRPVGRRVALMHVVDEPADLAGRTAHAQSARSCVE
jgi:hypothetical protein